MVIKPIRVITPEILDNLGPIEKVIAKRYIREGRYVLKSTESTTLRESLVNVGTSDSVGAVSGSGNLIIAHTGRKLELKQSHVKSARKSSSTKIPDFRDKCQINTMNSIGDKP